MRLVADIGGTNARFALVEGGTMGAPVRLPVAEHSRFEDALRVAAGSRAGAIREVAIAAAGPVRDGAVRLTNADWEVSPGSVVRVTPGARVRVLNDLEAVAHLLPELAPEETETLQRGLAATAPQPRLALNVGTGFGAAVAVPCPTGWAVLATEAGHMRLPEGGGRTVEDALSGPGLARLRSEVGVVEARAVFSRLLGRVAGDLALATGAWGGVFFCGGVLGTLDDVADRAALTAAFADRPGLAGRLAEVPLRRIVLAEPALTALARLAMPGAG